MLRSTSSRQNHSAGRPATPVVASRCARSDVPPRGTPQTKTEADGWVTRRETLPSTSMPELPEMEAWRRALDEPVRAFPIVRAGPAHVATLKTFDPPLSTLEGRRLAGARRRAKRLLFPTDDGELVLLVHLMTAGRLRYLRAGEKGPKTPAFRLRFEGGAELVLTEGGPKKRAGVWLLTPDAADEELAHLGPDALGLGAERLGEIPGTEAPPLHPL